MNTRRLLSLIVALAALCGVLGQFALNGAKPDLQAWGPRAWDLLRYFTILTNLMVAWLMLRETMGRRQGSAILTTAALNIAMVGIIYQTLLAPETPLQGWNWVTDFLMHAAVPVAMVAWWAVFAPRRLSLAQLPLWLIWPVVYCIYALLRGAWEHRYPYFFLDIDRFGAGQITLNIIGLVGVFAGFGLLFWGLSRWLPGASLVQPDNPS